MENGTASFADFARRLGCKRSYITELRKADRLVLTADGRAVRVAESITRIDATRDPAKAAVAARHAAARAVGRGEPATAAEARPAPAQPADGAQPVIILDEGDDGFQYWRRRSEKAKALAAERDNAAAEGKLLDAGQITTAVGNAVTTLRARLESLADVLGPQLAPIDDEARIRALIAEAIQHALEETSRAFGALAKGEGAA